MSTYEAYQCMKCNGRGEKYDSTMAEYVGNKGTGMTKCSCCDGKGYNLRIVWSSGKSNAHFAFDGKRMPEYDTKE